MNESDRISEDNVVKTVNPSPFVRDSMEFLEETRMEVNMAEREAEQIWQREREEQAAASRIYVDEQHLKSLRQYELQKVTAEREKVQTEERKILAEKEKLALELELAKFKSQNPDFHTDRRSLQDGVHERKEFDVSRNSRLIPKFEEDDPESFFMQFEKLANTLQWPREYWTILIQTVLVGKARKVYGALTGEECKDYDKVKDTVLQA